MPPPNWRGGQKWAVAKGPWIGEVDSVTGAVTFPRYLVHCHTKQMNYATEGRPAWCKVFEVEASWERCSDCPMNHGITIQHYDGPGDVGPSHVPRFAKVRYIT